jgi:hypothetical protein
VIGMSIFKPIFVAETKELYVKRNLLILFVVFLLLILFLQDGINDYAAFKKNQEAFKKTESEKVKHYVHMSQYGTYGIRILFIPSPISILFSNSAVYSGLIANIDTGERLGIYNSFKGRELFVEPGGYMDFSGIIFLLSCLIALLYGFDSIQKKDYLKFLSTNSNYKRVIASVLISRITLMNLIFVKLIGLSVLFLLIKGINVINVFLLYFFIVLFLLVIFFILAGAAIGAIKNKSKYIFLIVCYFVFIFLIPWTVNKIVYIKAVNGIKSNYKLELDKLKIMMDFERRFFKQVGIWQGVDVAPDKVKQLIQSGQEIEYKKLWEYENKMVDDIVKNIKIYLTISAIFPTTFYLSNNKEICSKGFRNFLDFYRYTCKMKYEFIKFYIQKKFYEKSERGKVESFVKGDENLFYGKNRLSSNFLLGIILTIFYIFLLFLLNYKIHCKRFKTGEYKKPQIDFKEGQNSIFVLCKDNQIKDEIFRYYEQQNAICLDKINTKDFRFYGIGLEYMFNYLCRISGVDKEIASENLALLGITDLNRESHEHDTILKIYTAIKITADSEFIVLNDFLKKESRNLEENVFELLTNLEMAGKKIIYLSTEMYYTKASMDKKIKVENTVTFPLFMDKITVR